MPIRVYATPYKSMKKIKKIKKYTVGQMKKKAWNILKDYIRLRDCLKTTGTIERGHCYTCDKVYPIKELQGGHLLDGHVGMNYLDERGVMAQCYSCNVCKHGLKEIYIPKFTKEYGQKLFNELSRLKRTPCLWKQPEYEKFIEKIKKKIEYIESL